MNSKHRLASRSQPPQAEAEAEANRLIKKDTGKQKWHQWGPYLSERQWGTVREDYSATGEAWDYFSHDQARSRTYRWGEDGIGGISDQFGRLCLSIALWNGEDPILKERLFGLTNSEGNHGEDVKELYYYLDAAPSHAYLKMLYKYPQKAFPYADLVANGRRDKSQPEYELLDTGVFDDDRYFDVFIEYAKAGADDILLSVTAHNRGDQPAPLHLLPQLWFRNTWRWSHDAEKPTISLGETGYLIAEHPKLGRYYCYLDGEFTALFCDNETNSARLYGQPAQGYPKDAFHDWVIDGNKQAVNPTQNGTKAAGYFSFEVPAKGQVQVRLRLTATHHAQPFADFDAVFAARISETDAFYAQKHAAIPDDDADNDARQIARQACAGLIFSKQFYHFDIPKWLDGDPCEPPPPQNRQHGRNKNWPHFNAADIILMPDKWEYPWFAAWDLAFHCVAMAEIDIAFAKHQLLLMTRVWYMHPNGQIPAYEWAFDDVNPPVHAWAVWHVYERERNETGHGDLDFLERSMHKLLMNFTWWVNRKDVDGLNIFQGGFLGLDNIGVFDRSAPLPTGGYINQADGTSWMAMYSLNMMRIALEIAKTNPAYEDIATKFFEHFLLIAAAMNNIGAQGIGLWDEEDQFFYDVLRMEDGQMMPLKVRSMVGLIPLFAVEILEPEILEQLPDFKRRLNWFLKNRPELAALVSHWDEPGRGNLRLLALLRGHRMKKLLTRMLDETEFLSDFGVRSLSRVHEANPYEFTCMSHPLSVSYQPAESESGLFGGNSNWRGPIWFPLNFLLVQTLRRFYSFYGPEFTIECPTHSGQFMNLDEIADELSRRLGRLFRRDSAGKRAVFGARDKLQNDPNFHDHLPFHEYFHGNTGEGLGASHQTGWTALIAQLLKECPTDDTTRDHAEITNPPTQSEPKKS